MEGRVERYLVIMIFGNNGQHIYPLPVVTQPLCMFFLIIHCGGGDSNYRRNERLRMSAPGGRVMDAVIDVGSCRLSRPSWCACRIACLTQYRNIQVSRPKSQTDGKLRCET